MTRSGLTCLFLTALTIMCAFSLLACRKDSQGESARASANPKASIQSPSDVEDVLPPLEPDTGIRWANSPFGLRLRSAPSTEATIINEMALGTKMTEIDRQAERVKIDGKVGYWIKVSVGTMEGWVFSPFISWKEPLPLDQFIAGSWEPEPFFDEKAPVKQKENRGSTFQGSPSDLIYDFNLDGTYTSGNHYYGENGTWSLAGNHLTLSGKGASEGDETHEEKFTLITISWIDANHLTFTYSIKNKASEGQDVVITRGYVRETDFSRILVYANYIKTRTKRVQRCLEQDWDPNQLFRMHNRPIHYAAQDQNLELCRILLAAGAEPDPSNVFGMTPLHIACSSHNNSDDLSVIKLLVEAGADVNAQDADGYTPLDIAKSPKLQAYLTSYGAIANIGQSPPEK